MTHHVRCWFLIILVCTVSHAGANPEDDRNAFQEYFYQRFPAITHDEFGNGVYALNADARQQWQSFEEFPPYEDFIETGDVLFHTPFQDGASYGACFKNNGIAIRQHFPRFNPVTGNIDTLESAINDCRIKHNEPALDFGHGDLVSISAYMAYTSRGQTIQVIIPQDPRAIQAYEAGKRFYYSKRGQLNMSCAGCHVRGAGLRLRAETTSPALGQTTHFPVYRLKWQDMGSLHRRFAGCNKQIRAAPFPLQSKEYRQLEYFLTYMSNGLLINGPGLRQ